MRFGAQSRKDFPAVGDWVAKQVYDAEFAIIHHILPRESTIFRQAVGEQTDIQIIATNIDKAFLAQAVDRDFNLNRLERYLNLCYASKVSPVIVLTKIDLIDTEKLTEIMSDIKSRILEVPVLALSNQSGEGYPALTKQLEKGKTYCVLGSSGVGKSSLINRLSGQDSMKTGAISQSTHKGRHVTSHRQLVVLASGAMLIDTPGMREVGLADTGAGLETTFNEILQLGAGCAVLQALEKGKLDREAYNNYIKMQKEQAHYEMSAKEKRRKDKDFGKMVKNYKKSLQRKKF